VRSEAAATGRPTNRPSAQAKKRGRAAAWEEKKECAGARKTGQQAKWKERRIPFFLKHISKAN